MPIRISQTLNALFTLLGTKSKNTSDSGGCSLVGGTLSFIITKEIAAASRPKRNNSKPFKSNVNQSLMSIYKN